MVQRIQGMPHAIVISYSQKARQRSSVCKYRTLSIIPAFSNHLPNHTRRFPVLHRPQRQYQTPGPYHLLLPPLLLPPSTAHANSGILSLLPLALPSNQSVRFTTLLALSALPPSSACSIVWVAILPSSSNSKMNKPQNSSSLLLILVGLDSHSVNLLTCSRAPIPRYKDLVAEAEDVECSAESEREEVLQRTMRRSLCVLSAVGEVDEGASECMEDPYFTMRSEVIMSLTLPTMGTRPHATGADQRAAW